MCRDADVVCMSAKQTVNYAKPQLVCPGGCELNTALGEPPLLLVSGSQVKTRVAEIAAQQLVLAVSDK